MNYIFFIEWGSVGGHRDRQNLMVNIEIEDFCYIYAFSIKIITFLYGYFSCNSGAAGISMIILNLRVNPISI
jgi:hypothetical protein